MPGLYGLPSWTALPLQSSCVKACANGYTLGITANLTYINLEQQAVEGVFVYPLEESEVVSSFEAKTGNRTSTFQIQTRPPVDDCCLDCNTNCNQPLRCSNGHLILDGDQARSTFIISAGLLEPSEILTVLFSTSQELATLPNGAMHVSFPSVLMPLVLAVPESESETRSLCDDRLALCSTSCFGSASLKSDPSFHTPPSDPDIFRGDVYNPFPYEFSFEMLVNGPCLLAGLESPSHTLRADANPYANSASTICITLADKHSYDKNLEIILHPSEPHHPHLIIEDGAMTYGEYEAHIRNRWDYARIAKKDTDGERQVAFVQKRFHKDIFYNPVLMLNFCPEISSVSTNVQTVTREIFFLVDQTGSDALVVAIKSLPSSTLLNVAGLGPNIRPAFKMSKPCNSDIVRLACEYIQKLRADVSGTSLLAALNWSLGQPLRRGYPRQLFILLDSSVENPGKVIELVRRQASTVRYEVMSTGLKLGNLLNNTSALLIKSLKKAIEPAVSDITIDWYVPDTMEALLSPNEIATLYPGDRLISYCTLYHVASFRDKKATVEGSAGLAFPSQEGVEGQDGTLPPSAGDNPERCKGLQDFSQEISMKFSPGDTEESMKTNHHKLFSLAGGDPVSGGDIWKRIYQPSYIQEQYVLTHCSVSTDPSQALCHSSTSSESTGSRDVPLEEGSLAQTLESTSQQGQKSVLRGESFGFLNIISSLDLSLFLSLKVSIALSSEELMRKKKALARTAMSGRSFSSPHGELDAHRLPDVVSFCQPYLCIPMAYSFLGHLLSPAHLDWDMLLEPSYLFSPSPASEQGMSNGNPLPPLQCQVVIHALSAGEPVSWEVIGGLDSLFLPKDSRGHSQGRQPPLPNTGLEKQVHRLTAASVIRDNETVAQREAEVEHGFFRRFRLKAVQSSKACNLPSMFTSVVPVESSTKEALPLALQVRSTGRTTWSGEHERSQGSTLSYSFPSVPPPQVQLQQAPGMFHLNEAFSEAVQIPLDRLCRASPYPSHRASLSPASSTSPWALIQAMELDSPHSPSTCSDVLSAVVWAQADSGRGSETDAGLEAEEEGDVESMSWATAVALAWLEHRSAGFFVEWELLAAKADCWLRGQQLPEGLDVAALKGAARQLFLLLRHWDENIKLNMLCYNPNNV
uniref:von Willebrand factor A domain containing 5B2 n=1 Tax=Pseudonaja textilis TaxID=8673 RepID=A0A670ZJQ7_PSETE